MAHDQVIRQRLLDERRGSRPLHWWTCVSDAITTGYRLIDTAAFYGNEEEVGNQARRRLERLLGAFVP